jgi:hypothetical protein
MAAQAEVVLKILDLTGRVVAVLVNGLMPSGEHSVVFEPDNLASGLYFYRLQAGEFVETRRLLLIR